MPQRVNHSTALPTFTTLRRRLLRACFPEFFLVPLIPTPDYIPATRLRQSGKNATMSRNQKHVDAGIKQLVGHIIPKARTEDERDYVQETVNEHIQLAHAIINE